MGKNLDRALHTMAYRFVQSTHDPALSEDDFYQEAQLALYRATKNHDGLYGPMALSLIGKRAMIDFVRRSQTKRRNTDGHGTTSRFQRGQNKEEEIWDSQIPSMLSQAIGQECFNRIFATAVKSHALGEHIIKLRIEGYNSREIGEQLHLTEGRISQILKIIREQYNEDHNMELLYTKQ